MKTLSYFFLDLQVRLVWLVFTGAPSSWLPLYAQQFCLYDPEEIVPLRQGLVAANKVIHSLAFLKK